MRYAMRFGVVVALLAFGATQAQAQSCEPGQAAARYPEFAGKTVKVGASPTYPPFTFTDPKDPRQLTGLEADLTSAVMACAGLKSEFVLGAWSGLLPSIVSGSIDAAIGNVVYRPDRGEKVDFVLFMRGGQSVIVGKGNPKKIGGAADLCGTTGSSVVAGASALEIDRLSKECVAQGKPPIAFQPAVDQDSSYRQLANARIDFVMDGTPSAATRLAAMPDFQLAYTLTTDTPAGIIIAKGNQAMLGVFANGMKALEKDGTLKTLMAKYGLPADLLIPVEIRK